MRKFYPQKQTLEISKIEHFGVGVCLRMGPDLAGGEHLFLDIPQILPSRGVPSWFFRYLVIKHGNFPFRKSIFAGFSQQYHAMTLAYNPYIGGGNGTWETARADSTSAPAGGAGGEGGLSSFSSGLTSSGFLLKKNFNIVDAR